MGEKTVIRGFVMQERSSGLWLAFCVDLNLAVQSETRNRAQEKLNELIVEYLEDVLRMPPEIQADLFPRRAPASIMFRYYLAVLRDRLSMTFRRQHSRTAMPFARTAPC